MSGGGARPRPPSAPSLRLVGFVLAALAAGLPGCIDMALPPLGSASTVCSAELREGFLQTVPGIERRDLWVAFIDVGHGDATWIRTPGLVGAEAGELLIDAGDDGRPVADHVPDGGRAVLDLMARAGMAEGTRLDALLVTHPDDDHYGGAAAVLERHPADAVLHGGRPADGPTWARLYTAARAVGASWGAAPEARTATRALATGGRRWSTEPRIRLIYADPMAAADNDTSLIIEVRFAGRRILLLGDAGPEIEAIVAGRIGPVDVLRTAHHGGQGSSAAAFLERVLAPGAHAVISAGGREGLPHPAVVERLGAHVSERVWRTDRGDRGRTRRASAGDDHILLRISAADGRVEICFLDPDPLAGRSALDP